jgi:DNA-binding response OmpR family regulator
MDQITKKRIMIVGRDSHFSYLLQRFVRTSAYRAIPVNLGDDVLSLAKDEKPVAIVLEVDTPEVVGWKALHALKSDPDAAEIPVIVCSWLDESARGLAEGADACLRMPFLYEEFGAALTTLLGEEENGEDR